MGNASFASLVRGTSPLLRDSGLMPQAQVKGVVGEYIWGVRENFQFIINPVSAVRVLLTVCSLVEVRGPGILGFHFPSALHGGVGKWVPSHTVILRRQRWFLIGRCFLSRGVVRNRC